MRSHFATEMIRDNAVVHIYGDGSRRVFFADKPLGRRVQPPGPKCADDEHEFLIDKYPGCLKTYVDAACRKCSRRIPIKLPT